MRRVASLLRFRRDSARDVYRACPFDEAGWMRPLLVAAVASFSRTSVRDQGCVGTRFGLGRARPQVSERQARAPPGPNLVATKPDLLGRN